MAKRPSHRVPWYRTRKWQRWFKDLAQTAVVCVLVGGFLALSVNSFDVDELRELGAVATAVLAVLRVTQGRA